MSNFTSPQLRDALDTQLPVNRDAERMVLGCILLDNDLLADVAAQLAPADFFLPTHCKVFRAMAALAERTGGAIDPVSLADELRAAGELEAVGGVAYLASLFDGVPRFSNVDAYVRLVKDAATARALIAVSNAAMQRALENSELPDAQLAQLRAQLDQIEGSRAFSAGQFGAAAVNDWLHEVKTLQDSGKPFLGVGTGLRDFDYTLGGLQRGDLIVFGARPSMGKTAAAARLVQGIAEYEQNEPGHIVVFSLEMSPQAFAARLACGIAQVNSERARNGMLSRSEWQRLSEAQERIARWPLTIFSGQEATSVQAQGALLRRVEREHKRINAVLLDHLGFCEIAGYNTDKNVVLYDRITKFQKRLAVQFDAPFVLLSQLSRANEGRGDKRPMLSDLRESGGIEQQADVVVFPHRQHYYDKHEDANKSEWIIAKQRNGALRTIELYWDAQFAWFDNKREGEQ